MKGKPTTRRRICQTCEKRTAHYIYPNGVLIPQCGCPGYFDGELPFEDIPSDVWSTYETKYQTAYIFDGPGPDDITRINGS